MFTRKSAVINIMEKTCQEASVQLLRDFNELGFLKSNKKLDQFIERTHTRVLQIITTNLLRSNPNHGIIRNNAITKRSDNNFYWMVNPLNGEQNFIHRLPFFGIGIALLEEPYTIQDPLEKNVIAATFYDPLRTELFYAEKDKGTFLNDRKLYAASANIKLSSSIATPTKDIVEKLIVADNSSSNRNFGSSLIHMAYVAAKRLDSTCEKMDNLTDIAIGKLLISEARGTVSYKNDGKICATLY